MRGFLSQFKLWLPLALVFAATAMTWRADLWLKDSSLAGYVPAGATCVLLASDFGRLWSEAEELGYLEALSAGPYAPVSSAVLLLRKRSGIRLTSWRWDTWLGRRFVWAKANGVWGGCVRPGILLRFADFFLGSADASDPEGTVRTFGGYFYAWRDGFVVFSQSSSYVLSALDEGAESFELPAEDDELHVYFAGAPALAVAVKAAPGLPVRGWTQMAFTERDDPLTLAGAWPTAPLLSVTASKLGETTQVAAALIHALPGHYFVEKVMDELRALLPRQTDGVQECSLALISIDVASILPIPEVAFVERLSDPDGHLATPYYGIPFEWNEIEGQMYPWYGEKLALCIGVDGRDRFMVSRETLMARFAGRLRKGLESEGDVVVTLNWSEMARALVPIILNAADYEMIPGMNERDAKRVLVPLLETIARFGEARVYGASDGRITDFSGHLALELQEESSATALSVGS